mmetsp:Transcript_47335/g.79232  ORF Transcript_47335/g.79232 Transcript_47335/m.79232 type:complete len:303 (-) Transcript_47335:964-1872(-)
MVHRIVCIQDKLGVCAHCLLQLGNVMMLLPIKCDRVLCILNNLVIWPDFIWDICIRKAVLLKIFLQAPRIETLTPLQQLEQINDLMVTPVPDIGMGMVRLWALPCKSFSLVNNIWIVAVDGACIQELGNDACEVVGEADSQCLPVLEDVTPIALEIEDLFAVLVLQDDVELVPWAGRVPMASTPRHRHVLRANSCQILVARGLSLLNQLQVMDDFREIVQPLGVLFSHIFVALCDKCQQVLFGNFIIVVIDPTTHAIEHDVGVVVGAGSFILQALESVCSSHDALHVGGALRNVCIHEGCDP